MIKTKEMKEREALNLIEISSRKMNVVKLNTHNTIAHELAKTAVAYYRIKLGHNIITEAKFKTGGICDVVDVSNGEIIEILASETKEEAEKKVKKYPEYFSVLFVTPEGVLGGTI